MQRGDREQQYSTTVFKLLRVALSALTTEKEQPLCDLMEVSAKPTVVTILQHRNVSDQKVASPKLSVLSVNYSSIKLIRK